MLDTFIQTSKTNYQILMMRKKDSMKNLTKFFFALINGQFNHVQVITNNYTMGVSKPCI